MGNIVLVDINHKLNVKKGEILRIIYNKGSFFNEKGDFLGNAPFFNYENPFDVNLYPENKIIKGKALEVEVIDKKMTKKAVPSEAYLLKINDKVIKKFEKNYNKKQKKEQKRQKDLEDIRNGKMYRKIAISRFLSISLAITSIILSLISLYFNNL